MSGARHMHSEWINMARDRDKGFEKTVVNFEFHQR